MKKNLGKALQIIALSAQLATSSTPAIANHTVDCDEEIRGIVRLISLDNQTGTVKAGGLVDKNKHDRTYMKCLEEGVIRETQDLYEFIMRDDGQYWHYIVQKRKSLSSYIR